MCYFNSFFKNIYSFPLQYKSILPIYKISELTAINSYLHYKISIAKNIFLGLINHPEVMLSNISALRSIHETITSGDQHGDRTASGCHWLLHNI